jgi:hypothetical protein
MHDEIVPNRWVRFTRAWDWDIPKYSGKGLRRATKHFPAGTEIRLTRDQHQSAIAAGVAVSIPNPRLSRRGETDVRDPV